MRLGLISDIHGDVHALRQAWAHLTALGVERILCAGDLVGYGPDPDDVVAFLAEREIASVCGNHDRWALSRPLGEPDEFGGGTPSLATLDALRALPPSLEFAEGATIGVVVHGSPRSDMEFVTDQTHPPHVLDGYLAALGCDLLVVGHTHVPMWYRSARGLVVNPGSVISVPVVKSSSTFAVVDLADLSAAFYRVENAEPVRLAPWFATPA